MWVTHGPSVISSQDNDNETTTREPDRMMGGERTRAYRYGMTLLCVGALFNWLGLTENNSDPVKFIGYTCLASGALLVCMAICFWANSAHRHVQNQVRPEPNNDVVVNIVDPIRDRRTTLREKPPDYDTVADLSPPPSYDDAIRLSPSAYLSQTCDNMEGPSIERCHEITIQHQQQSPPAPIMQAVTVNISPPSPSTNQAKQPQTISPQTTNSSSGGGSPRPDSSPLTRVIRLSSRLLRRTLSNIDHTDEDDNTITNQQRNPTRIHRCSSAQEIKGT